MAWVVVNERAIAAVVKNHATFTFTRSSSSLILPTNVIQYYATSTPPA
jgi:hypothetical protein